LPRAGISSGPASASRALAADFGFGLEVRGSGLIGCVWRAWTAGSARGAQQPDPPRSGLPRRHLDPSRATSFRLPEGLVVRAGGLRVVVAADSSAPSRPPRLSFRLARFWCTTRHIATDRGPRGPVRPGGRHPRPGHTGRKQKSGAPRRRGLPALRAGRRTRRNTVSVCALNRPSHGRNWWKLSPGRMQNTMARQGVPAYHTVQFVNRRTPACPPLPRLPEP
jgi:hypothetical protein